MDKRVIWGVIVACVVIIGFGIWSAGRTSSTPTVTTPGTTVVPKELEITSTDWVTGNKDAAVTIVEYGDFQCPACGAYHPVMKRLLSELPDKFKLVYRHYPLTNIHEHAWGASKAAEAAGKQGKYWEMHGLLFEKQNDWAKTNDELASFSEYAKQLGINVDTFKKDYASSEVESKVHADQVSGDALGVNGTPTFFVNGSMIDLPGSPEAFKALIETTAARVSPMPTEEAKVIHEHADLALFIDGKKFNLSDKKYDEKNPDIHTHDGNGDILHKHKTGVTLGTYWTSLGLTVKKPTVLYVNEKKLEGNWEEYEFKDLDRLALATADLTPSQVKTVGDKACIYSETCPERGKPPTENCVGGLNTPCENKE